MGKRMRRRTGLTALFWRYLLVTGGAVVLLAVLWWGGLSALLRSGFVLPAGTAAGQADGLVRALEAGELTPAELPHYYRWATFDGSAQVVGQRGMDGRRLGYARAALEGDRTLHGFPYQQYHRSAQLPDGTVCLLQFDYSMPYGSPALQESLPEFQTCATAVLLAAWLAAGALSTRHFAGRLRRDAALLTAATGAIAARRLDVPLDGGARVRELGESLAAMEQLRQALARSLSEQWAMEQERTQALAALAHDLKTPCPSSAAARSCWRRTPSPRPAGARGRHSPQRGRIRDYMEQLRALTATGGPAEAGGRATAELSALAEGWAAAGRGLCAPRGLRFSLDCPASRPCTLFRSELDRAVLNLLDNAARFTPEGGAVRLSAYVEEAVLTVAVEDSGPGFSPEALARAGRGFYTGDASRPREGHMGMGLTFARQTARRHGGTLELSNTGRGARAALTLPL
ncbi:MAG: sensor histidine kinase [Flavonifractor plautii]